MTKRARPDPNQLNFEFRFEDKLDSYISAKQDILDAVENEQAPTLAIENEFEACVEIAAAVKRAIRQSGMSRDQVVDGINTYFGRSEAGAAEDPPVCRKPLSIHMFNNYLSKPTEYPIPAYYLYAVHHVTGSLEPAETIVSAENAKVATGAEIRQMKLGKLEQILTETQRLKRELKKR
ncbi:hypothetical protein Dvar_68550 [Desulfosarcina variabilis str. Montpellier]|uniref:hypothetical protein n=1 Tax=Desulfosarcina variabilis TaxID=2300 RepID=UPI003AFB4339